MKKWKLFFDRYNGIGLCIFVVVLAILYAALSILRHMHFQSGGFDLGLYDQAVWRFSQFLDPFNTIKQRVIFGDHLVLTLPLLGPLFYLWNDVRILLIEQAVAISVSALPIYLVALKRLQSRFAAWTVMIIYSLFFGIQFGVFFDFHPIILGVSLLAFLIYSIEYRRKRLFWIFLGLCLLTQENMGIAVAGVGICYLLRLPVLSHSQSASWRRNFFNSGNVHRNTALLLLGIGLAYSALALKIISLFSPIGYEYQAQIPSSVISFVQQLFDSEEKRLTWLYSYSWFSFLPLFSPGSVIAVVLDLSQYFVTGDAYARMWSPFMHHRAILSIFLTLGLMDVLVILKRWKRVSVIIYCVLLIVVCINQYQFHFALNKLSKAEYWKEELWMEDLRQLIAFVPKNASVATQQNLVPHLSHRKEIFLIYPRQHDIESMPCGQSLCWWLDFAGTPDYLVVDTRPNQWLTQILETNENWLSALSNMEKTGTIIPEKQVGDAKMYRMIKIENRMDK